MKPIVRPALAGDVGECEVLENESRRGCSGVRGADAFLEEHPRFFRHDDGFTLVAEFESVIVGFVTVRVAVHGAAPVATIERIRVTEAARRVGVGDALLAGASVEARTRGCTRLDALALPGDRDTKNLYERNGLTARLITASRPY